MIYSNSIRIEESFQQSLVKYCLRVLDQIKIGTGTNYGNTQTLEQSSSENSLLLPKIEEIIASEVVRILDLLCIIVPKLVYNMQ